MAEEAKAQKKATVQFEEPSIDVQVAERIMQLTAQRNEVGEFLKKQNSEIDVQGFVRQLHQAAGYGEDDCAARQHLLEQCRKRHTQLLHDRRVRKKDKLLRAAKSTISSSNAEKVKEAQEKAAAEEAAEMETSLLQALRGENLEWTAVDKFKTEVEAVRFIMKCQPFDFQPVHLEKVEDKWQASTAFPKFENSNDALSHVINMSPIPKYFQSQAGDYQRRLRITYVSQHDNAKEERGKTSGLAGFKKLGQAARLQKANDEVQQEVQQDAAQEGADDSKTKKVEIKKRQDKEYKPYVVQAAGDTFAPCRGPGLRELRETPRRYFIAMDKETETKVLVEGYRVSKRTSIPCSLTPGAALQAFRRYEEKRGDRPSVNPCTLAVSLPPHVDVITHKDGGFFIRATEIPPAWFKDRKRAEVA
eukprot:TRINITY_DN51717_c0_g1_i1.p1 TRINITY_DN51717_c0_g1~~TRINITY_DN51717_c0_g1_i1.p1  ORF type:complete len:417 (+),score=122.82 TRINITY_DN51717_c0_g1_i1:95-1345(+)